MTQEILTPIKERLIYSLILPNFYRKIPHQTVTFYKKQADGSRLARNFTVRTIPVTIHGKNINCRLVLDKTYDWQWRDAIQKKYRKSKTDILFIQPTIADMCYNAGEHIKHHVEKNFSSEYQKMMKKKKVLDKATKEYQNLLKQEDIQKTEEAVCWFDYYDDVYDVACEVLKYGINHKLIDYTLGDFDLRRCTFSLVLSGNHPKDNLLVRMLNQDEDRYDLSFTPKSLTGAIDGLGLDKQKIAAGLMASQSIESRMFATAMLKNPAMSLLDPEDRVRRMAEVRLGRVELTKHLAKEAERLYGDGFIVTTIGEQQ